MADQTLKIIRAFELAKRVNHYYWEYLARETADMSIESIQLIVERMIRLPIKKSAVPYKGQFIRGIFERYKDRVEIYIRDGQEIEWIRFTIVKELCHALIDQPADYSPKGEETIRDLIKYNGIGLDDLATATLVSERLAEIVAIELIYPLEFREPDSKAFAQGEPVASIVKRRVVPSVWVQRALQPANIATCKFFWNALAKETPPPLKSLEEEPSPPTPLEILGEIAIDAAAASVTTSVKKPE